MPHRSELRQNPIPSFPGEQARRLGITPTEAFNAGFMSESAVAALADAVAGGLTGPSFPEDPSFDPAQEDLTGYEGYYAHLLSAGSRAEFQWRKSQVERLRKRRMALEYGGGWATLGQLAGAVANPDALMGVGAVGRLGRLAGATREGARFGSVAAAQEGVLHAANPERTAEESALTIATATAAGMTLGAIGGARRIDDGLSRRYAEEWDHVDADLSVGAAVNPSRRPRRERDIQIDNLAVATGIGIENIPANPILRGLKSESTLVQDAVEGLTEIPFLQRKNLSGQATKQSVWTRYIVNWRGRPASAIREMERHYLAYRQRVSGDARKTLLRQHVADLRGRPTGVMSYDEFRRQVGWAKSELDDPAALKSYAPEVVEAARRFEDDVYGPLGKAADEHDVFTFQLRRQIDDLERRLDDTRAKGDTAKVAALQEQIAELHERIKIIRRGVHRPGYLNRIFLPEAIRANRAGFRAILMRHLGLDQRAADELVDRILREKPFEPIDDEATGQARSLYERTLRDIPDRALEGFIERDIALLSQHYAKQMGVDVELARAFDGEIDLRGRIQAIRDEYMERIEAAKDEKEKDRLKRAMEADIRDVRAIRDMVRGTYALPDDPTRFTSRAIRMVKHWNALTLLTGSMAALPDMARIVMVHGLERTFRTALVPLFRNFETFRLNKAELNRMGEALDTMTSMRALLYADLTDMFATTTKAERQVERLSRVSFSINLMNQWTDLMKGITAMVAGTRILEESVKLGRIGNITNANRARLASQGIDLAMAKRIAEQAETHGVRMDHNWLANTDAWTDREAAEAFRAALVKDVNATIVTPAPGDRALWTSKEWGGLVAQFKGFAMAAHQRVLIAGLQQRDADFVLGAVLLVGLGGLIHEIRRWQRGDDSPEDFTAKLTAAVDRSGVLGWFMDANNALERVSDNALGIGPLFGDAPPWRMDAASRLSGALGPTATTAGNLAEILGGFASGRPEDIRGRAVRRALPLQNVWYADGVFGLVEDGIDAIRAPATIEGAAAGAAARGQ